MSDIDAINDYWLKLVGAKPPTSVMIGFDRFHLVDPKRWLKVSTQTKASTFGTGVTKKYEPRSIFTIRGYLFVTPIFFGPGDPGYLPTFGIEIEERYETKPGGPNVTPSAVEWVEDDVDLARLLPEVHARWVGVPRPEPIKLDR